MLATSSGTTESAGAAAVVGAEGSPEDVVHAVRRGWTRVLAAVALGAAVAALASYAQPPRYVAYAEVILAQPHAATPGAGVADDYLQAPLLPVPPSEVATNVSVVTSPAVMEGARQLLGHSPLDAVARLSVDIIGNARVLRISAVGSDPQAAAATANAVADSFVAFERDTASPGSSQGSAVLRRASAPEQALTAGHVSDIALGAACGLVAGIGIVVVRSRRNRLVVTVEHARVAAGDWNILGTVDVRQGGKGERRAGWYEPSLRLLALSFDEQMRDLHGPKSTHVVLLCGVHDTELSAALAVELAAGTGLPGRTTAAVDADVSGRALSWLLGSPDEPGLTDTLVGDGALVTRPGRRADDVLRWVPVGAAVTPGSEPLASRGLSSTIEGLGRESDLILISAGGSGPANLRPLVSLADLIVGVAPLGSFSGQEMEDLREAVGPTDRPCGVVLIVRR